MYSVQKIAMPYWPGPEKAGETICTVGEYPTEEIARAQAALCNRELAGNMWQYRYIVVKGESE